MTPILRSAAVCAWLAIASYALAQQPANALAQAEQLIEQLGDESFGLREQAAEQLIQLGVDAQPALEGALDHPDAEVRFRARRILAAIASADFGQRLKAFAADLHDARQLCLPGWIEFKKAVGIDPASRSLFVEMQHAEAPLLRTWSEDPDRAADALAERVRIVFERARSPDRHRTAAPLDLGSVTAILWVAGDPTVPLPDKVAARVIDMAANPTILRALQIEPPPRREALRKIVGRFVARDVSVALVSTNMRLAASHDLPQAVDTAVRVLRNEKASGETRCFALIVLGKSDRKEHVPLVESFLDDTEPCANFGGFNRHLQTQIRDVALTAVVRLSGKDPHEFGLHHLQDDGRNWYQLNSIGFPTDADRAAAMAKWQSWKTAQTQPAVTRRASEAKPR